MSAHILVVDDDPHILDVICFALNKEGMRTLTAQNGREALRLVSENTLSLIVLDIGMPELDGLEVCKQIRKASELPILFLSSRDEEVDRIIGLEIGGDDYVTKPFSPRELVARIKAILKRSLPDQSTISTQSNQETIDEKILQVGELTLDPSKHRVSWEAQEVELTSTEFLILKGLMAQPDRVFERAQIMDKAYGNNINVSDRTIDSHIRHIRSKLATVGCDGMIKTVHGVGYKLTSQH